MKKSILAHEVLKAVRRDVKDKEEQRQTVNKGGATQQIYILCSCLIGEHLSSPSEGSLSLANMKAIVLLCLLHAVFGQEQTQFSWYGPVLTTPPADPNLNIMCSNDQAECGCCLMKKQMARMEELFNMTVKGMSQHLMHSKMTLNNIKNNRTAFSVALNNERSLTCFGPFSDDRGVPFKHVFLNLGNSYNVQTGIFTVPYSGVYNLAATVYSRSPVDLPQASCALLQLNGVAVAPLVEKNGLDSEDSNTVVVVKHLKAGDQVSVNLQKGCNICDDTTHYNTFTGFMLYAAEKA
ncbi:hypothetical protein ILYODFUR_015528 [Ilyodon furcidens]|uniref:C1q domain-containing protein n=1 Tax=Ilyodon furcidens TaxID=33524 RepID=A0ABV0V5C2_9TELE